MKLRLPDITLVMIETQSPALARLAMEDSMRDVEFGDTIAFTDQPIAVAGTRWVKVPKWPSVAVCTLFMWYQLPNYIKTKWAILIQWDSWIVNADCWTDEFLDYDYIGAPWWHDDNLNVGNGCGLRSLALMRFLQTNKERFPLSTYQEDHLIGRVYRPTLEQNGFRWPSEVLASRFSLECTRPSSDSRHFMFHDSFNFPSVLDGERLAERVRLMRANPAFARKVAELDRGRQPIILPRLGAPQKQKAVLTEPAPLEDQASSTEATAAPTFREFQKARVDQLLKTRRSLYSSDTADAHNFLPGLVELILQARPQSVIELGSDRGVATELFLLTTARVVAIDSWENQGALTEFVGKSVARPTHISKSVVINLQRLSTGSVPNLTSVISARPSAMKSVRRDILACARIVKPERMARRPWLSTGARSNALFLSMIDEPMVFRDGSWLAKNRLSQRFLAEQGTITLAPAEADCAALAETASCLPIEAGR